MTIGRNPDKQPAIVTDATSSPIRYVKRQNSEDPPDYSKDFQQNTPSPNPARDPSKRASVCESGGGDVIFYGKKKPGVLMDHHQEYEGHQSLRGRDDYQSHSQPSGNFSNHFQSQIQNHEHYSHHGSPIMRDTHRQRHNSPPKENGNVTVYVMNNKEDGGVAGGLCSKAFFLFLVHSLCF